MTQARTMVSLIAASIAALGLTGCGTTSWFSNSTPKPALPAVSGGATLLTAWSSSLGGKLESSLQATSENGRVFAAHSDGSVLVIDEKTGAITNRFSLPAGAGRISGGVAVGGGLVVVSSNKAEVYAFDAAGALKWKTRVATESIAPAAITDGVVIVSTLDGNIVGLDAKDGARKWIVQRNIPALTVRASAVPVAVRGGVFVGTPAGRLIALDALTGTIGWEATVANPRGTSELERLIDVAGRTSVDTQRACAAAYQGRVACFDLLRGTTLWSREVSSLTGTLMDNRHVYATDEKGVVHALDRSTGGTVWKQDVLAGRQATGVAFIGDHYGVQDIEGNLHLLDKSTGKIVARGLGASFIAAGGLTQAGDGALLTTRAGQLVLLRSQ
ncbi:MAG: outer membrane protein assembly factor BamB [Betaproteobacteria bacterium]|nr:MAG: outer membrane protein assembly factor BamB [Betaproteobacteria bacterium]